MAQMTLEAKRWVQQNHPYWNRCARGPWAAAMEAWCSGAACGTSRQRCPRRRRAARRTNGADHIWLYSHDEGACWAPTEIANTSIILTHWGRLDRNHSSQTAYWRDE
jgi:hypothetical protein